MGYGKSKESAAQERKNLLGINPIADHASGSWMSKHSIAGSGSTSPLHSNHKGTDAKTGHGFEGAPEKKQEKYKDMNVFKQLKYKYWDKADYSKGITQRDINRELYKKG